jgi:hypothetical protein
VREMQRDSRAQVFDLLGKAVGQPRKPAHLHKHGQVLPRPGTGIPFPIMRGESRRGLDTEPYGETNQKDSWEPHSLWPSVDSGSTPPISGLAWTVEWRNPEREATFS